MLYTKTNARIINYQNKLLIAVHIWDKPTTIQWVSVAQNMPLGPLYTEKKRKSAGA